MNLIATPQRTLRTPLRLQVVDRLGALAPAWDDLATASGVDSPFVRSWWVDALATSRTARIVLVHRDDRLVGGLALQRRRLLGVEVLQVLGGGRLSPDHVDLLARPGHVDDVLAALADHLGGGSRLLDLDGLRDGALAVRLARTLTPGAVVRVVEHAPYEALPADPAAYLASRGSGLRTKGGKGRRRLERAGLVLRRTPDDAAADALDDLARLHRARGDREELLAHLPELRRVVELGVAAGEVSMHEAVRDDVRVGVLLGFTTGGRWSTYQIARSLDHDLRDVGTVLYLASIDDACRRGASELDLLRGDEPYKLTLAARTRPLLGVRAAVGLRGRLLLAGLDAARAGLRRWRRLRARAARGGAR